MIHYLYVMKVEAIFISDVHLGARGVQAEELIETLKKYNPEYYDLLLKYYKLTKIPLLINTSFNLHEEHIVTSPEQVYRSFVELKIDALVLNKYLILKKNNA